MSDIIGRAKEQAELEAIYNANESAFVAVYGRRRIGKTYLIKNFFQGKNCVYFQMTGIYKGALKKQLERFAKELGTVFYQDASIKTPANWLEAFEELNKALSTIAKNKKIVLFFDELPWMHTRKSGIISALEYFWNRHWVDDKRIKLITCGSAASWIIKYLIKNRGGLHNRVTHRMRLLPFNLYETALYLKHLGYRCDYPQTIKIYMALGGVPFYLKNLKKNLSIDQNIENLLFAASSPFFDEFDEVFSSLFENAKHYKEIVTLIAKHKDGIERSVLDEKTKSAGSQGGRLTQRLEDLENAGFISSYIPFEHKKLGLFYRLSDEYCYFYLQWIEPLKLRLKQNKISNYWRSVINTPAYFNWCGYVFENICYKHLPQIRTALQLDAASLASPWRYTPRKNSKEPGTQIDLLFDRSDNAITICEIKYTAEPFSVDKAYAEKLRQRLSIFKEKTRTKKQLFFALVSAAGIKPTLYSEDMVTSVVTVEDLFQ